MCTNPLNYFFRENSPSELPSVNSTEEGGLNGKSDSGLIGRIKKIATEVMVFFSKIYNWLFGKIISSEKDENLPSTTSPLSPNPRVQVEALSSVEIPGEEALELDLGEDEIFSSDSEEEGEIFSSNSEEEAGEEVIILGAPREVKHKPILKSEEPPRASAFNREGDELWKLDLGANELFPSAREGDNGEGVSFSGMQRTTSVAFTMGLGASSTKLVSTGEEGQVLKLDLEEDEFSFSYGEEEDNSEEEDGGEGIGFSGGSRPANVEAIQLFNQSELSSSESLSSTERTTQRIETVSVQEKALRSVFEDKVKTLNVCKDEGEYRNIDELLLKNLFSKNLLSFNPGVGTGRFRANFSEEISTTEQIPLTGKLKTILRTDKESMTVTFIRGKEVTGVMGDNSISSVQGMTVVNDLYGNIPINIVSLEGDQNGVKAKVDFDQSNLCTTSYLSRQYTADLATKVMIKALLGMLSFKTGSASGEFPLSISEFGKVLTYLGRS